MLQGGQDEDVVMEGKMREREREWGRERERADTSCSKPVKV